MSNIIEVPATCKLCAEIFFLLADGHSAAEIHCWMSNVYGKNFMSDGCVQKWCRKFEEGRTDVHNEADQGRKSVATKYIVEQVVCERCSFTISELSATSSNFKVSNYRL